MLVINAISVDSTVLVDDTMLLDNKVFFPIAMFVDKISVGNTMLIEKVNVGK